MCVRVRVRVRVRAAGPAAYSCLTTMPNASEIGLLWETSADDCVGPSCRVLFTVFDTALS